MEWVVAVVKHACDDGMDNLRRTRNFYTAENVELVYLLVRVDLTKAILIFH